MIQIYNILYPILCTQSNTRISEHNEKSIRQRMVGKLGITIVNDINKGRTGKVRPTIPSLLAAFKGIFRPIFFL